ncbi:MAG: hypothetical protein KDN18_24725, partial [Verrucomicrobiae bacterium]|nr:hypothetical protein [Verrucomicrobiae bacterium]
QKMHIFDETSPYFNGPTWKNHQKVRFFDLENQSVRKLPSKKTCPNSGRSGTLPSGGRSVPRSLRCR